MPNEHGKTIDKTFLSLDLAEERGFIHRDYIAHCMRWSHVIKFLQQSKRYDTAYVLDLGCGKEAPLLKTLYSSRLLPAVYAGIDYGPIVVADKMQSLRKFMETGRVQLVPNTNILDISTPESTFPDVIVMFEALEHMEKEMGIRVLEHIQKFMASDTTFFMSTPCYDGKNKAGNHVYEWRYDELHDQLLHLGFTINGSWGTFASIKDYKQEIDKFASLQAIFDQLREYYDVNMLACLFAPLFPSRSRNCLWQLSMERK